ncbi:MAG: hypothetical protein ABI193_11695 [Minicystis sp.]
MTTVEQQILAYRPDRAAASKFRESHVEGLLNQSASLVERCIDSLREFHALDFAFNDLDLSIKQLENDIAMDESRRDTGIFDRDSVAATSRKQFLDDSQGAFNASSVHAQQLFALKTTENQLVAGYIRAGQNVNEKALEDIARNSDRATSIRGIAWAVADAANARTDVANRRAILDERKALLSNAKAFDLHWQRDLVGARLLQDWRDTCDRVSVVQVGLLHIYGYKLSAPVPALARTIGDAINALYSWIRVTLEWLVAYSQCDQAFSSVFSMRDILKGTPWDRSTSSFVASFQIDTRSFGLHDNVRLRGIGGSLVGAGLVPWSIVVNVPQKAVFERKKTRTLVNQSMPSCLLEHRTG